MKKLLLSLLMFVYVGSFLQATPDEGMWLPVYIKQKLEGKMQSMGLKLTAEDIYDINNASIKDAILRLGTGFCTGELVSEEGLVFTNHHCGYDAIATLSTVDNDFLTNGFWAASYEEEIPIPDFTVSRMVYMKHLTPMIDSMTVGITDEGDKMERIKEITDSIQKAAIENTRYEAEIKQMYAGNEYYLVVYETFKDVRFVGAPPSSIGKYGGDTDNWMWPRHTGDFSILRVYTGTDGKPAEYSEGNIPYKPLHHLPVSLGGVEKNDFAFIMGYPGTTERYLTSYDIDYKMHNEQPALIFIFDIILENMKAAMDKDDAVRIELASDYASLANSFKYFKGQNLGLENYGLIEHYKEKERKLMDWMKKNPDIVMEYGNIFDDFEKSYNKLNQIMPSFYYVAVGILRLDLINYIGGFKSLYEKLEADKEPEELQEDIDKLREMIEESFKHNQIDRDFKAVKLLVQKLYVTLEEPEKIPIFKTIDEEYDGENMTEKIELFFDEMYEGSLLFDKEDALDFLEKPKSKKLKKEMSFKLLEDLGSYVRGNYMSYLSTNNKISDLHSDYMRLLRLWKKDEKFYPDANSTLRLSYGKVTPYYPRDAVYYHYLTTHYGILDKYIPGDEEFDLDPKLVELLKNKDFGPYGVGDTLYVCFLTNNDITGGNSGSPVINDEGHLIGIAFDGNWEAMTGDLVVDPKLNRTISVDIRYVLFVIDKFAGAQRLIDELTIIDPNKKEKVEGEAAVEED